jgi:hypothetical protein
LPTIIIIIIITTTTTTTTTTTNIIIIIIIITTPRSTPTKQSPMARLCRLVFLPAAAMTSSPLVGLIFFFLVKQAFSQLHCYRRQQHRSSGCHSSLYGH